MSVGRSVPRTRFLLAITMLVFILLGGAACAPQKIEPATAFSLDNSSGRQVSLSQLLEERQAVVLVFYRGFF